MLLKISVIDWKGTSGTTWSWTTSKAALQEQVDALKKKSEIADENLAKTQKQLDETTKTVEENNMLLRRLLTLNGNLP